MDPPGQERRTRPGYPSAWRISNQARGSASTASRNGSGRAGWASSSAPSANRRARVALKVLRAELSADETFRRRFVHEARAAGEVRHKHLVPITDAGEAEGRPYLAVAFVRGQTLEARLASDEPMPLEDVVRVVAHVASGLDALHAGGIVHRDVKPSNVIIDETGSASLTDFGLAKGRAYTVLTKPGW